MSADLLVFVSHSSHSDAGRFRREFVDALEKDASGDPSGFVARVDSDLLAGKSWNDQLYEWMAEVHAAVILLTDDAIKSPHVLQEATSLVWRAFLDDNFELLPVRLDDVDDSALRDGPLGPLEIHRIQWLSPDSATDLAAEVKKRLARLRKRLDTVQTPLDRLIAALRARLANADPTGLNEIATRLMVAEPDWRAGKRQDVEYVSVIARRLIRNGADLGDLKDLAGLVDVLRNTGALLPDPTKEVLDYLAPLWVAPESAGVLPEVAKRPASERWATAINGDRVASYTARMYVERAYPVTRLYRISYLAGGYDSGSLLEQVDAELRAALTRDLEAVDDTDLDDQLEHLQRPYFVILPAGDDYERVLGKLLEEYPMLTFVLHTGRDLDVARLPSRVCAIAPAVGLEEEKKYFREYRWALDAAR